MEKKNVFALPVSCCHCRTENTVHFRMMDDEFVPLRTICYACKKELSFEKVDLSQFTRKEVENGF